MNQPRKYYSISQFEEKKYRAMKTKDIEYFKDLFSRLYIGRMADVEFYDFQAKTVPGFSFTDDTRSKLIFQANYHKERIELFTMILQGRNNEKQISHLN